MGKGKGVLVSDDTNLLHYIYSLFRIHTFSFLSGQTFPLPPEISNLLNPPTAPNSSTTTPPANLTYCCPGIGGTAPPFKVAAAPTPSAEAATPCQLEVN